MYFVHPQIKLSPRAIKGLFLSFFRPPDKKSLEKIKEMFPQRELVFTDMGRSAFKLIVERLGLQNSQIMLPAYICDIFSPILDEYNISPIFLDIDKSTFHIKEEEIKKKISEKTKAILVCHTYGLPVDIERIREITNNKLLIIEDCAHAFGARYRGRAVGQAGQAALFSLYKQFPSLRGGMAVLKYKNGENKEGSNLPKTKFSPRDLVSLLNCFSPFAFLFKKFGARIAPRIVRKEKLKRPSQINSVSLNLFLNFSKGFRQEIKKRVETAQIFREKLRELDFEVQEGEGNVFCYLSALTPKRINRDRLVRALRGYGIFATRIWREPIILNPRVRKRYKINLDEFPNTIEVADRIINFPLQNFYTEKDIEKMTSAIKKFLSSL